MPSIGGELVTVTVDDRQVQVPTGLGLVETAAAAGIEIPVFCYEPRLGAPIGACRMCLVEIEGMGKPQAGCTLSAQDGMVVRTAHSSALAADAQNANLELMLVNHPLDCPVCDKGGECPLQDLTFRYGPGSSRMTFSKRTFDKPIPISPLIALDRERCILCYRCTRFSEEVAEDGQLVARNRGAETMIATFEDRAYRAPFSGNVLELCPVGALTSTLYRFEARPWEIQNVPTVCGLCPGGCNVSATIREGKVQRILSRNHPEIDAGWICDKGRFIYPALRAADRVGAPLRRAGARRFEEISWSDALAELERLATSAGESAVLALSGSETVEIAWALSRLVRQGFGSHHVVLPEEASPALDAFRAPLSSIGAAELVVVIGDAAVVDRAPIVDLWIRAARRAGAEVISFGPTGSLQRQPGDGAAVLHELADRRKPLGKRLREAGRASLIWSGPGGHGGAELARLAHELGFHERQGCGAFYLPATPNGGAVDAAWKAAGDGEPGELTRVGLLLVSGEEAASDQHVRRLAEQSETVVAIAMYSEELRGWANLVLPGTGYLERNGTMINLEGRVQRLRRAVDPPGRDELDWIDELARLLRVDLAPPPSLPIATAAERGQQPVRTDPPGRSEKVPQTAAQGPPAAPKLRLARYRPLFSGASVERVAQLAFQRPEPVIELSPEDAHRRAVASGDVVTVRANGTSVELRARINQRLVVGAVRAAEEHVRGLPDLVEVRPKTDAEESARSEEGGSAARKPRPARSEQ